MTVLWLQAMRTKRSRLADDGQTFHILAVSRTHARRGQVSKPWRRLVRNERVTHCRSVRSRKSERAKCREKNATDTTTEVQRTPWRRRALKVDEGGRILGGSDERVIKHIALEGSEPWKQPGTRRRMRTGRGTRGHMGVGTARFEWGKHDAGGRSCS